MIEEESKMRIVQKAIESAETVESEIQSVEERATKSWLKVVLFSILGALIFAGAVFGAYKLGQKQAQPSGIQPTLMVETTPTSFVSPTPTPDLTANWKTYTNTKYGFEVKYPKDWKMKESETQDTLWLEKTDSDQEEVILPGDKTIEATYRIGVQVIDNPHGYSAKDYYLKDFSLEKRAEAEKHLGEITIGGVKGIKYLEAAAPSSGLETVVSVSWNGKIYRLSYGAMAHQATHDKFINIFNLLLSTFKFLE